MGAAYTKPKEVESVAFPAFKESPDAPSLKDKNIAITGCTSGTGLVAAKFVAEKGAKTVFLLNRPSERAEKALAAKKTSSSTAGAASSRKAGEILAHLHDEIAVAHSHSHVR